MSVLRLAPDGHSSVESQLPWYAAGRLQAAERAEVEAHLMGCARCRAELDFERRLQAALALPDAPRSAEAGLAALRQRISAKAPPSARPRFVWWHWALGAQFVLIACLLALLLAPRFDAPGFRALGNGGAGANAVVMFSADTTEAQIRNALRESGAHLVGGPTVTHAYLLLLPRADAGALQRLRSQAGVTLAEGLEAGSAP